jgi:hypothetical protein
MMKSILAPALTAVMFLSGCAPLMTPPPRRAVYTPAPCNTPVHAIRNSAIVVTININATYNAKDLPGARNYTQGDAVAYLNDLGRLDGNTFSAQNGNANNFTFNFVINNDGQDHFTGSLDLWGWGVGHIHMFTTQYSYANGFQMLRDLTGQAYQFMHTGWADTRPSCPQY